MNMKDLLTTFAAAAFILPSIASAQTWSIDSDHSSVGFKVRHMMVTNVAGRFGRVSGTVDIDETDLTKSTVDVTVDTASIDTGVAKRDDHLKSAEFFDSAKYPVMTFVSKAVEKAGDDRLKVRGDLTLHGVTKQVVLDVEGPTGAYKDPWGNIKRGAAATGKINRKDFGLVWNAPVEGGGVVVGEEVTLVLEVELLNK